MEKDNARETLSFLEERNLPFVCVDMPQGFDSSLPPVAAATTKDLSMVRFHGRNIQAWEQKTETASERFRYEYKRAELAEWVPRIQGLAHQTRETHVLMNNCYQDFAVRGARDLGGLLDLYLAQGPGSRLGAAPLPRPRTEEPCRRAETRPGAGRRVVHPPSTRRTPRGRRGGAFGTAEPGWKPRSLPRRPSGRRDARRTRPGAGRNRGSGTSCRARPRPAGSQAARWPSCGPRRAARPGPP